jgi:hypothetical protein
MIAWIIGIITAILLAFVIWRKVSKSFRERCEAPKYRFLESLGVPPPTDQPHTQKQSPQEDKDGTHHP